MIGLIDSIRKNETVVVGAVGIGENSTNTAASSLVRFRRLGDAESGMRERSGFPPFPGVVEKEGASSPCLGMHFSSAERSFYNVFPQTLCQLVGLGAVWLEAHHGGHLGRIGLQAGVETGIVVLDGRGRVLQTVAGEHTHHLGSRRYFVFALE